MSRTSKSWLQFDETFALDSSQEMSVARFQPKPLTRIQWRELKVRRREAERKQLQGIESQDIFKLCIESKLEKAGAAAHCAETGEMWFANFLRCGRESFYMMCGICGDGHDAFYQCSQKWCPRCNWRISMKRRELLEHMTRGMSKVKHVVLTRKNVEVMTRAEILSDRKNLFALRRQKIFGKVTGGCASLEFTHEDAGWHPHWHLLVQSSFINPSELSIAWGKLVGQQFAIVKVMAVTEKSYLQEICKYVVEGSELSKWPAELILEFVIALRGTRCFTTFGKFQDIAKHSRLLIREERPKAEPCSCGCNEFVVGHDRQHCKRIATKKGY